MIETNRKKRAATMPMPSITKPIYALCAAIGTLLMLSRAPAATLPVASSPPLTRIAKSLAGGDELQRFDFADARLPALRCADPGRSGAEDDAVEPAAGVDAQPLPGQSADGQAAEMGSLDAECIHERDHVAAQIGQAQGGHRSAGLAMSTAIIAQDAEPVRQTGNLGVPHVQVRAQGIAEGQPGFFR